MSPLVGFSVQFVVKASCELGLSAIEGDMKNLHGFTLIELMVTLAVGIVILAIGIPSFLTMMSNNQATAYANELVGAIRYARSEAVNRASDVAICASNNNQTACSGTDWNNGWVVFTDDNRNDQYDAGEKMLRVWSIETGDRSKLAFSDTAPNDIRFNASGANVTDTQIQFAFKKTDCQGDQARQITISRLGWPSVVHVACF
jgi:type IV fimbrial biogenesis protein FimT